MERNCPLRFPPSYVMKHLYFKEHRQAYCPKRKNFIFLSVAFYRPGFRPMQVSEFPLRGDAAVTNSCLQ